MSDDEAKVGRRGFLRSGGGLVAGAVGATMLANATAAEAATTYYAYAPLSAPVRMIDSRDTNSPIFPGGGARVRIKPNSWPNPAPYIAICVNLTVTGGTGDGYLALFAGNVNWSGSSNVNWSPGWTIANNAYSAVDPSDGALRLQMGGGGSVHFILDAMAILAPASAAVATVTEAVQALQALTVPHAWSIVADH